MRAMLMAAMMLLGTGPAAAAEPVQVMVLGVYHFGNPGQDLNNAHADDVTTPKRQAELRLLADALARYHPTKIMVEAEAKSHDLIDTGYASFTADKLAAERSEVVQIGYRLARQLGHSNVYAIDEQPGPGEPDYFPFDKVQAFAAAHGEQPKVDALMQFGAAATGEIDEKQKTMTIPALLADINRPESKQGSIVPYYRMLDVGDTDQQPGAELNALWYMRNAKIFAKLMSAVRPGDRVLVIFGAGHGYWLRHFASQVPGYVEVDPIPYLRQAAR